MNLSITPINFNTTANCKRNNNQAQNFEALPIRVFRHPEVGADVLNAAVKRDKVVDKFMGKVEELSKKIGINTDKFAEEGYSVEFIPKFPFSSKMSAALKDKGRNIVKFGETQQPLMVNIRRGNEFEEAENFTNMLQLINLEG